MTRKSYRKQVTLVNYLTRDGKRRVIKLYKAWRNIENRVAGRVKDGNDVARWKGLEIGFKSFAEFRAWALSHGYRRGVVLDRKDPKRGYTPDNCEWVTKEENAKRAAAQHEPDCVCWHCRHRRGDEW